MNKSVSCIAFKCLFFILLISQLASCGGGGSESGPSPIKPEESNNSFNTAKSLQNKSLYVAGLNGATDSDYYVVHVPSNTTLLGVQFAVGPTSIGNADPECYLYDDSFQLLLYEDNDPSLTNGGCRFFTLKKQGIAKTYYLMVKNNGAEGNYSVVISYGSSTGVSTEKIESNVRPDLSIGGVRIEGNKNGNAIGIWNVYDYDNNVFNGFYASYYTPDTGWGSSELISSRRDQVQAALDKNGNGVLAYAVGSNIWIKSYFIGLGWGRTPQLLQSCASSCINIKVTFDENGNALMTWSDATGFFARYYTVGGTWGAVETLDTNTSISNLHISFDNTGNVVAIWDKNSSIVTKQRNIVNGWGATISIGNGSYPQFAVDSIGNAIAVWYCSTGICANRYTPGNGWGAAYSITPNSWSTSNYVIGSLDSDLYFSEGPQIGFDGSGNAISIWYAVDNIFTNAPTSIWTARYVAGVGWGAPEILETVNQYDYINGPQLSVSESGNAAVLWAHISSSQYQLRITRHSPTRGWGSYLPIMEPSNRSYQVTYDLTIDNNGEATAIWIDDNETEMVFDVWGARVNPP